MWHVRRGERVSHERRWKKTHVATAVRKLGPRLRTASARASVCSRAGNSGRDSSSFPAKIRHRVHVGGALGNFSMLEG